MSSRPAWARELKRQLTKLDAVHAILKQMDPDERHELYMVAEKLKNEYIENANRKIGLHLKHKCIAERDWPDGSGGSCRSSWTGFSTNSPKQKVKDDKMIYNDFKGNKWIGYLDDESDDLGRRYVLADTPDDILEVLVDLDICCRSMEEPGFDFSRVAPERYFPIRDRLMKERGLTKERLGYDD